MSFIASLAAAGTAIASGAAAVGGTLAAGAGAIGSGLAAGAGALGSGIGALGTGLASGAGAVGSGLASGASALGSGLGIGAGSAAGAGAAGGAGFAGLAGGTGLTAGAGAGGIGSLGAAGSSALGSSLSAGSLGLTGAGGAAGATGAGLGTAAAPGLGAAMGATGAGTALPMAASLGGEGLATSALSPMATQALTGAAIGGVGGAVTHPDDPLKGALIGAGTGALGGAGASYLGGMAGTGGVGGAIGDFAAAHPYITSAAIGLPASMALNSATTPSAQDELDKTRARDRARFLGYMQNFRPTVPPGYAAGGITDLDGYMSDAQNIPNPQEVADPEGYPSNSMKLMAGGGLASLFPGGQGGADWLAKNSLPGMIFGWQGASDVPLIGSMFNDPNTANLTPEEKKKLMDNMAAAQGKPVQQMAGGGIADLGGYAAGGRPNLLHGPGDGVSDDIPASIGGKQPARLASGEYVVSSRIVSELGNGSTDAGAARLDEMVKRIQEGRKKTIGKGKEYAKDTKPYKYLPA